MLECWPLSAFPSARKQLCILVFNENMYFQVGVFRNVSITCCVLQDPSELRCPLVPLSQTSRLVGRLIEILPENHAQYSLALHLLEAVEVLTSED